MDSFEDLQHLYLLLRLTLSAQLNEVLYQVLQAIGGTLLHYHRGAWGQKVNEGVDEEVRCRLEALQAILNGL